MKIPKGHDKKIITLYLPTSTVKEVDKERKRESRNEYFYGVLVEKDEKFKAVTPNKWVV